MSVISGESTHVQPVEDEKLGNDNAPKMKVQSRLGTTRKKVNRKRKLPGRKQRLAKRMKQMKDQLTTIKKQQLRRFKLEGSQRYVSYNSYSK